MLVSASFTIYGAEPQSVLPFPTRLYSLQTNDLKPTFVYRYKNQILSPEMNSRQIISTPFQDNEKSPLYGEGINPMDLIHNANLLNSRSASDFAEDTDKNLNQAADDFKREQQRRIQETIRFIHLNMRGR